MYSCTLFVCLTQAGRQLPVRKDRYKMISIHSGYFYSPSSSPPLLRGAPDTAQILCWSFTPKRHTQLRVKDLPKVSTWRLEQDSNLRPFRQKATHLPNGNEPPHLTIILLGSDRKLIYNYRLNAYTAQHILFDQTELPFR